MCRLALPLRMPDVGEQGSDFVCADCGTIYNAILLPDQPEEILRNVRPLPSPTDREDSQSHGTSREISYRPQGTSTKAAPDREPVQRRYETELSRHLDEQIDLGMALTVKREGPSFADQIKRHGTIPYDAQAMGHLIDRHDESLTYLDCMFCSLSTGKPVSFAKTKSISQQALIQAADDLDLFVCLGLSPTSDDYPSRHSLHVAMLAVAIAANLGWDEKALIELGIGCLIHDIGMQRLSGVNHQDPRVFSQSEFEEITKHPLYSLELIDRQSDRVSETARLVIYQMHERCDGSGYPRGRKKEQIHEAARVAAVADVFVALVSPRPYRPDMIPYYAMEKVLRDVQANLFDPNAVRALVQMVSLFPVGSFVGLSDDRVGKVIRCNHDQYTRPIIEIWENGIRPAIPEVVNLAQTPDLQVVSTPALPEEKPTQF